jgi:peroxiredoxin Q/BCP
MPLEPGTPAPDFTLAAHTGGQVTLSSYRGKKVVLAFHPASFTGG